MTRLTIALLGLLALPVDLIALDMGGTPEQFSEKLKLERIAECRGRYVRISGMEATGENVVKSLESERMMEVVGALRLIAEDESLAAVVPTRRLLTIARRTYTGNGVSLLCGEILFRRGEAEGATLLVALVSDSNVALEERLSGARTLLLGHRLEGFPAVVEAVTKVGGGWSDARRGAQLLAYFDPFEGQPCGVGEIKIDVDGTAKSMTEDLQARFRATVASRESRNRPTNNCPAGWDPSSAQPVGREPMVLASITNVSMRLSLDAVLMRERQTPNSRQYFMMEVQRGDSKSLCAKVLGESVAGFVLETYEEPSGLVLTDPTGGSVKLRKGEGKRWSELMVTIAMGGGYQQRGEGETLKSGGREYVVRKIDQASKRVVIVDSYTGTRMVLSLDKQDSSRLPTKSGQ